MTFPSGWELVLVLLVILVLFGAKRLPDSARALGRSMRILKAETKGMRDDDAAPRDTTVTAQQLPPAASPPPGQYGQQPYVQPQGEQQPYVQPQGQQQPYAQPAQPPQGGTPHGDQAQQPRP